MNITLTKKQKYILHALSVGLPLYLFTKSLPQINVTYLVILSLVLLVGSYIVHLPNSKPLNILVTSILPVNLVLGYILSIIYFPNLSDLFKAFSLFGFSVIFYVISLVNNVFLVVETREEPIPLYRVATTWSKIIIAAVTIPLFAGIYKISINSFFEAFLTFVITLIFLSYLLWISKNNPDVKKYKVGEIVALLTLGGFIVTAVNISVAFFPTETFLRALYVSSVLIFSLSYIEAHLKNAITKKIISEHLFLSLTFLILLFIFKP